MYIYAYLDHIKKKYKRASLIRIVIGEGGEKINTFILRYFFFLFR